MIYSVHQHISPQRVGLFIICLFLLSHIMLVTLIPNLLITYWTNNVYRTTTVVLQPGVPLLVMVEPAVILLQYLSPRCLTQTSFFFSRRPLIDDTECSMCLLQSLIMMMDISTTTTVYKYDRQVVVVVVPPPLTCHHNGFFTAFNTTGWRLCCHAACTHRGLPASCGREEGA